MLLRSASKNERVADAAVATAVLGSMLSGGVGWSRRWFQAVSSRRSRARRAVGAAAASSKKQEEAKEQGRAFCIVITFPPKSPLFFTKFVLFRTSHTTQMCV